MVSSKILIFLLSISGCTILTDARSRPWRSTNPGGGGAFNSPVITSDGFWAVGSDLGGFYLSSNKGRRWVQVGALQGLTATHVASMAAHPDGRILVGTDDGIYVASSGGARTVTHTRPNGYVAAIAVTANPSVVYAAIHPEWNSLDSFLVISNDGGQTWSSTESDLPALERVTALRAHPVDEDGIWVITGEGRFAGGDRKRAYFSSDRGRHFFRRDPAGHGALIDVAYSQNPNNLNQMFATTVDSDGTTGRVFRSEETGFSWIDITPSTSKPSGIILSDATQHSHVRIIDLDQRNGLESYLWESSNSGSSWVRRTLSVRGGWSGSDELWGMGYSYQGLPQTIGFDPKNPKTVLWVNSQFLYISTNGGRSWRDGVSQKVNMAWASRGIDNVVPVVTEPSLANGTLVYAGFRDLGLWRSDNSGASWVSLNDHQYSGGWSTAVGGNTLSVVADPSRAEVVWAQVGGDLDVGRMFLLKSSNRGSTWVNSSRGLPSIIRRLEGLSIAPESSQTARWLTVVANGDVYLSGDDGSSWELVLDCVSNDCHRTIHTTDNGIISLSPSGIWRSWEGGVARSWEKLDLPSSMVASWTPGQHWLMNSYDYVGPVDAAALGSSIWVAVVGSNKGLYRSGDWGQTWSLVLNNDYLRTVAVDGTTGTVYAGSSSALDTGGFNPGSSGLHRSSDGVGNWVSDNRGLSFPFAMNIRIGPGGTRWLISPGQGIMKS